MVGTTGVTTAAHCPPGLEANGRDVLLYELTTHTLMSSITLKRSVNVRLFLLGLQLFENYWNCYECLEWRADSKNLAIEPGEPLT